MSDFQSSPDTVELAAELQCALTDYLDNFGSKEHGYHKDVLAEMLWDNKAGIVAALRTFTPAPAVPHDLLNEIIAHLGASIIQSVPTDDQIIMGHVKAAHELAKAARRQLKVPA